MNLFSGFHNSCLSFFVDTTERITSDCHAEEWWCKLRTVAFLVSLLQTCELTRGRRLLYVFLKALWLDGDHEYLGLFFKLNR
jgi:hypothetical protein